MDFETEIDRIQQRAVAQMGTIATEEATKTALVMPLLRSLGYDVFDPTEVVPEFTADFGIKKGEKVDYAITHNGKITMLFECKKVGCALERKQASQLYRYFTSTEARFGVLTDGIRYEFYSDLDERNKLDNKPFFIFDILSYTESDLRELRKFGKTKYSEDSILSTANDLKYGRLIDNFLHGQFESPSEELVRLVGGTVYEGRMTSGVMEWMNNLVRDALERVVSSRVRAKLENALQKQSPQKPERPAEEEECNVENGIVTTESEIEAVRIIKAILSEHIDPDRVVMRDAKSYCAVLLDDNNRKPLCRLYLEGRQWRIGTFKDKMETKHDILKLSDLFGLRALFKASVVEYDGPQ